MSVYNMTFSNNQPFVGYTEWMTVVMALYSVTMGILGMVGNTVVLVSSLLYNALHLDGINVAFVRNLALADIMYSVIVIFPQALTITTRKWFLGYEICYLNAVVAMVPAVVNSLLIMFMTAFRLLTVTHPFGVKYVNRRNCRLLIILVWVVSFIATVGVNIIYHQPNMAYFDPERGRCMSIIFTLPTARSAVNTVLFGFVVLPMVLMVVFNVWMCAVANQSAVHRAGKRSHKAGFMVALLGGTYVLSWTPFIVYEIMKMHNYTTSWWLQVLSYNFISINAVSNPFLYTYTNKRFNRFISHKLHCLSTCLIQRSPSSRWDQSSVDVRPATKHKNTQHSDNRVFLDKQISGQQNFVTKPECYANFSVSCLDHNAVKLCDQFVVSVGSSTMTPVSDL